MRVAAAIDCWMLALTRLSRLIGVYIMNAAKMNARNCPVSRRLLADPLPSVPQQRDDGHAAEELHHRRQQRNGTGDLQVRSVQLLRRRAEPLRFMLLAAERLDDAVAGERFGGQVREVLELLPGCGGSNAARAGRGGRADRRRAARR